MTGLSPDRIDSHVIQRGNNREFVFHDDKDKEYFTGQFRLLIEGFLVFGIYLALRRFLESEAGSEKSLCYVAEDNLFSKLEKWLILIAVITGLAMPPGPLFALRL